MSLVIETTDGPLEFSDEYIRAIAQRADFLADLTAEVLSLFGLKSAEGIPANMLLEFAALLQLTLWRNAGILQQIEPTLPDCATASATFRERVENHPESFQTPDPSDLTPRITGLAVKRVAWEPLESYRADSFIDTLEDQQIEALANFLWANRHTVAKDVIDGEES